MKEAQECSLSLRKPAVPRTQAFLLLTGLSRAATCKNMSPEQKFKCLAQMNHHIGNWLSEEVREILTKRGGCDPGGALEQDLNSPVNGDYVASNSDLQKEVVKQGRIDIGQGAEQKDSSKPSPSAEQWEDPKRNERSRGQEVLHLIKHPGL